MSAVAEAPPLLANTSSNRIRGKGQAPSFACCPSHNAGKSNQERLWKAGPVEEPNV